LLSFKSAYFKTFISINWQSTPLLTFTCEHIIIVGNLEADYF
jgi:hypothetical protein